MHYKILAAIFCNLLLILLIGLLLIRYGIQDKNEESNCIIIDTSQASMVNEVKYEEYNNIKSYNCKKIEEYTVFCNNIDLENVTNWLNNVCIFFFNNIALHFCVIFVEIHKETHHRINIKRN